MRLDVLLAKRFPETSRATWQKYIADGRVKVDGKAARTAKQDVAENVIVDVTYPAEPDFGGVSLPIIYEDESVIVVDKPAGVLTHAKGARNDEFSVAEFFRPRTTFGSDTNRPGIVHRLDRATSGVIIGAKNPEAARFLQKQFAARKTKKTYIAVLACTPKDLQARIDAPIGRNSRNPKSFRVDPKGKSAQTTYEVLATDKNGRALVILMPTTGRTHQLRVHMAFIGAPIMGDTLYGEGTEPMERMMLHAWKLEITIPHTNKSGEKQRKVLTADVPTEFLKGFEDVRL